VSHAFGWRWVFLGLTPAIVVAGTFVVRSLRPLPRLVADVPPSVPFGDGAWSRRRAWRPAPPSSCSA
jgi:hypothetical protein